MILYQIKMDIIGSYEQCIIFLKKFKNLLRILNKCWFVCKILLFICRKCVFVDNCLLTGIVRFMKVFDSHYCIVLFALYFVFPIYIWCFMSLLLFVSIRICCVPGNKKNYPSSPFFANTFTMEYYCSFFH